VLRPSQIPGFPLRSIRATTLVQEKRNGDDQGSEEGCKERADAGIGPGAKGWRLVPEAELIDDEGQQQSDRYPHEPSVDNAETYIRSEERG
jgi:hypothetical protein